MNQSQRMSWGAVAYLVVLVMLGLYFAFAAVNGEYGLLRRAEVAAEGRALRQDLDLVQVQVARMGNLTRRLSDDYLDLDLLDQQARDVLGMVRTDEIVIQ
jgi:cell division protein FtsB